MSTARPAGRAGLAQSLAAGFLAGLAVLGPATTSLGAEAPSFEFLYIEANEGGSSGGHAALRLGHHVYHFQNKDGLLVLLRESSTDFLYSYALLSNRTIHTSRIAVAPDDYDAIARQLETRRYAQSAQLDVQTDLERDLALLEAWHAGRSAGAERMPVPAVEIPALGYFARTPGADPSASLTALRARLLRAHGASFLDALRTDAARALALASSRDASTWPAEPPASVYAIPAFAEAWSRRVAERAAGLAAIDVLLLAPELDPGAVRAPGGAAFELWPAERATLARFRADLARQAALLFETRRPGWGRVALVAMARLAVLDASLATGRIVVLDTLPVGGERLDRATVGRRTELLGGMLEETSRQLTTARQLVAKTERPDELLYERYEERATRHDALERATRDRAALPLGRGHLIPSRSARLVLGADALRAASTVDFGYDLLGDEAAIERGRGRARDYASRLDDLYRYELITRNCVTALFETLNESFDSRAAAEAALGGWVDGVSRFGFIPFVAASQVDARLRVVERAVLPSYRHRRVAEMRADDGFLATLRESNTLTARAYRRADPDSFFVFFTDEAFVLRPLLGAVNLGGATLETAWGVLKLPIDRGRTLVSGLRGAFSSLPELAFGNIRKGSNDWIPPGSRTYRLEPRDAEGQRP